MILIIVINSIPLAALLCYGLHTLLKVYAIHKICKHPKLSDEKVKQISLMVRKDKAH